MSIKTQSLEKKERKGPISFDVTLSEEQKEAKRQMLSHTCTILDGEPGASKTFIAVNVALDMLFSKQINKIYMTRPPLELKQFNLGALPGLLGEKIAEFALPFYDAMKANYSNSPAKLAKLTKIVEEKQVEFLSLAHVRGRNLGTVTEPCVLIVDEAQSCNEDTLYAILTRLGEGSKLFLTCDLNQNDANGKSGMVRLLAIKDNILDTTYIRLENNYRSAFVQSINKYWFPRKETI